MSSNCNTPGRRVFLPFIIALLLMVSATSVRSQAITNLQQLTQTLNLQQRVFRSVKLEVTVCAASRPEIGVLIVQDDSGVELLEMGDFGQKVHPGERIRIQGYYCLLRKRDMGIEISAAPIVDNDGIHMRRTWGGETILKAGQNPMRLEWFN